MAGLDSRYVTGLELEEYFVDRNTGAPLSGGYIKFFQDNNRTTPKNVYELVQGSGSPPNYTYAALSNPLTLSGVGTIQDSGSNNIALYYYPYDVFGNTQLYYIEVYDQYNNLQFTREAWPYPANIVSGGGGTTGAIAFYNQITNGQFVKVLFNQGTTFTIPYTNAGASIAIAPDWTLVIAATGSGSMTVTQNPVTGSSAYPYNPPFTLDFVAGANMSTLQLVQQLNNNPDWAAPKTAGTMGYVSTSILISTGTTVTVQYVPSSGTTQTLLNTTNSSGQYAQVDNTVQLLPAASAGNGITGYDKIVINLPITGSSSISNVQIIPLTSNTSGLQYDQTPSNRQIDYMFHYYNPLLQYKPTPSHLCGWDFPLNPAQFLGDSVAAQAIGANKSYYAWDQTIIFQTTNSGVTISRDSSGALKTLSADAGGTQLALIQYLDATKAREMLSSRKCVNVSAIASSTTEACVSLWYTKDGSLPNVASGTNNSIVLTLDSKGYPVTQNGTWVKVPRSGLANNTVTAASTNSAQFTVGTSSTAQFNQYPLNGWDMQGSSDINNATFFAIVVGTAPIAHNSYILWQSISCQDGDIATIPASQSQDAVMNDCQRYYEMTFNLGTVPAQNVGTGHGEYVWPLPGLNRAAQIKYTLAGIFYKTEKRISAHTVIFYNPLAANAQCRNMSVNDDAVGTGTIFTNVAATVNYNTINQRGFAITVDNTDALANFGDTYAVNWTADARLGIV